MHQIEPVDCIKHLCPCKVKFTNHQLDVQSFFFFGFHKMIITLYERHIRYTNKHYTPNIFSNFFKLRTILGQIKPMQIKSMHNEFTSGVLH